MIFSLNQLDKQKLVMISGLIIFLLMFYCNKKNSIENFAGTCQSNYDNVYAVNLNTNIKDCCVSSESIGFNSAFNTMNIAVNSLPNQEIIRTLTIKQLNDIAVKSESISAILNAIESNSRESAKTLTFKALYEISSKKSQLETYNDWLNGDSFLDSISKNSIMNKTIGDYETIKNNIIIYRFNQYFNPMKQAIEQLDNSSEILPLKINQIYNISLANTEIDLLNSSLDDSTKVLIMNSKLGDLISVASKSVQIKAFVNYIESKSALDVSTKNIIYSKTLESKEDLNLIIKQKICKACCDEKNYVKDRNTTACKNICEQRFS
jgi:hypothetical protein|tara:strand:- start:973 stop:1935 length:963 start_codon:yes stop_codon:yes gene_type:complete